MVTKSIINSSVVAQILTLGASLSGTINQTQECCQSPQTCLQASLEGSATLGPKFTEKFTLKDPTGKVLDNESVEASADVYGNAGVTVKDCGQG